MSPIGHSANNMQMLMQRIGATTFDDVLRYLGGKQTQGRLMAEAGKTMNAMTFGQMPKTIGRMAGSKIGRGIARAMPAISLGVNVLDVADVVAGDESLANRGMDAAAMTIGGVLGAAGGPLGASIGASTGKVISDGAQWLFGDKKTPEQRKMELALAQLQGGGIY